MLSDQEATADGMPKVGAGVLSQNTGVSDFQQASVAAASN
jgi:hypothetical protein